MGDVWRETDGDRTRLVPGEPGLGPGCVGVPFRRMACPDGRLDLEFVPFLERVAATNLLVIASEVHQMFGRYYGTVQTDEKEVIRLDGLIGFAEEHHARW